MNNNDNLSAEEVKRIEDYVSRLGVANRILSMDFGSSFSQKIETKEVLETSTTEGVGSSSTP